MQILSIMAALTVHMQCSISLLGTLTCPT